MIEKQPRTCPECGGDRYLARDAQRNFEGKLRARGERPYEGAKLGETAPGAEMETEPPMFPPVQGLVVP